MGGNEITEKQRSEYIASSHRCLFCKSEDLETGSRDMSGDVIYVNIVCATCGKEWTDEYTLTGVNVED